MLKFSANVLSLVVFLASLFSRAQGEHKIEISLLGTFHFNQFHDKDDVNNNFFGRIRQEEITVVIEKLKGFQPDQIYIEREPHYQFQIDSLYKLYKSDKLSLDKFENGEGEVYQLGFRLAKELNLDAPKCVNYYESISQSLLESGRHIEKYQNALMEFQNLGRNVVGKFLNGKASLLKTLQKMNLAENIALSHNLLFNVPAYVQEGEFSSYAEIDKSTIDRRYIGAEFISLFYERNLKIYSNILRTQMENNHQRILFITGQVHVGVLQELLQNNGHFKITKSSDLLTDNSK